MVDPNRVEPAPSESSEPSPERTESVDDHLPTTRLPPLPAPPPRSAGASAAGAPATRGNGVKSWWLGVSGLLSDPRGGSIVRGTGATAVERCVGAVFGGFGLALFFIALGVGLHSAPDVASQPVVAAATVLARAAVACGIFAFGLGLLRMGERLFVGRDHHH